MLTWIEREFNACQTHGSMYTSIFNRLRAIARYWLEIATFSVYVSVGTLSLYGRIFQPIFTKFGKKLGVWIGELIRLGSNRNPKMSSPILTPKTPKLTAEIGNSQPNIKCKITYNLWIKTVKPIIKDTERNKYVLDADKSRDPWSSPLGAWQLARATWPRVCENIRTFVSVYNTIQYNIRLLSGWQNAPNYMWWNIKYKTWDNKI